ncbi:thiamine phosphate synthase [Hymenobacter volaticus]|uniref:Thiamine phosphate synthase n=1 Tax=Hymenobacter volaticus TaxID=2932254 RepID=A0ABY4GG20_9BACT|nr:thiamine phosphate synthase [Hymenobacter volaticus]UOQ69839.1 thiamine phosphate synthase [Hymenobacter volaticus]
MSLKPFSLVVVSPPEQVANEVELLVELFRQGLLTAHIRKPDWTLAELEAYLQLVPAPYHQRLVLHSHHKLALRYKLKGIHLTEKSRSKPTTTTLLRQLRGQSVSASFHSLEAVVGHRRPYDYVFLSPIFDSTSKADYRSNFRLEQVQEALRRWQGRRGYIPQVVALGGITPHNIRQVQQAGFAGAAVLGGIWQQPDPLVAFQQLQSEIS